MVSDCEKMSYTQRSEKLPLTTLEERYMRADMMQVFKIVNDKQNVFPKEFLKLNNTPGRMNSRKLYKFKNRLEGCKHGFTSRVVDKWNVLPDSVILSEDVKIFKTI